MFQTHNPFNGEVVGKYDYLSEAEIELRLEQSQKAWQVWRRTPSEERKASLMKVAQNLRLESQVLSTMISKEMGKTIGESRTEIEKSALAIEYIAENFEAWQKPENIRVLNVQSHIQKESLGPLLSIMPWNYPVWQVIRVVAPNIAAGNVILNKGSELVAGTSALLAQIFKESISVPDVFQNFQVNHLHTARAIGDRRVRAVTFTGSPGAGRQVGALAGQHLKKVVLELGGNDAYLLLDDCEMARASKLCAESRLTNMGQSCIAAKRFFVPRKSKDAFLKGFAEAVAKRKIGDPLNVETSLGVIASSKFKENLDSQVLNLVRSGAKPVWESKFAAAGNFFQPIVLEADLGIAEAHVDEIFGPVALMFCYDDLSHAIEAANSSPLGLGAGIFSADLKRAQKVAQDLEVGVVAINDIIKLDARLPFGGVKNSGFGRELSHYGFHEFLNLKTLGLSL